MKQAAAVLKKNKLDIIQMWVEKVREELPASRKTSDPVLRDHIPLLLEDFIKIMRDFENFKFTVEYKNFGEVLDNSVGHGRHRSSSSGYDIGQVLKEYIILHRILTEALRKENALSPEATDLLKYAIENSMLYAVVAFNQSLQEIQQNLLGVLAHDIRNPASVAYTSMGLLEQNDDPEKFQKIKEISRNSIKRAIDMLEDLLETVSVKAGEGITLHFSERNLVKFLQSLYEEASAIYSNKFVLNCEEKTIRGVFDSAMIRRVLENIINNAVKYGKPNSPITIDVKDKPEKVFISVHNNGNPIPKEKQKEIFTFLNSTNGQSSGELKSWGMGLSLVKAVAKAHGGHLELKSNEEEGTTFTLVLGKTAKVGEVKTGYISAQ